MAKAQLKILVFLITVGLVAGSLSVGWWFYMNVLLKESQVEKDIAAMKGKDRPRIDPGLRRFEAAVDLIREGQIDEGRDALYKLRLQFPDSAACPEAMRIIGEINMDQLYSHNHKAGKKDYIVQPGNTLLGIATKHDTTVDSIIRMNSLMSTLLQPGDHLTLIPMDFHLGVDVSSKQVMLLRKVGDKEYLFKVYDAKDIRLPPGTRLPVQMELAGKNATHEGKTILSTDPNYAAAEKWISGTKAGVIIRTPPVAKAIPVEAPKAAPVKGATPEAMPAPAPSAAAETGIFLGREDIEELFALVRRGSKLSLVR
jgi:LysM repeat protein